MCGDGVNHFGADRPVATDRPTTQLYIVVAAGFVGNLRQPAFDQIAFAVIKSQAAKRFDGLLEELVCERRMAGKGVTGQRKK